MAIASVFISSVQKELQAERQAIKAFGKQFSEPAIYPIPGLVLSGENDTSYFQDQLTTVKKLRRENHARMHMIVEPGGGHWGGDREEPKRCRS